MQALGHCGACHTPHGLFGQEHREEALDGGWSEGWYAPALNAASPASSAIAAYLAAAMRQAPAPREPPAIDRPAAAAAHPRATQLFEAACAGCHTMGATMMLKGRPGLERGSPLWEADPRDTLKIVLDGLNPPLGESGPFMPAFADTFRDDDLADLAAYLRVRYTDRKPWKDSPVAVRNARSAR